MSEPSNSANIYLVLLRTILMDKKISLHLCKQTDCGA